LTEIKESVGLLWRNDVPPGKVVLGTGFYGRSFQLNDTSCDTPGCPFGQAANKGDCTDEGGILGYFGKKQCKAFLMQLTHLYQKFRKF
jgi:chitinase